METKSSKVSWSEVKRIAKKETHNHVNNVQQMHDGEEKNVMDVVSPLPTQLVAFIFAQQTNLIEVAVSFIPLKVLNERRRNKKH